MSEKTEYINEIIKRVDHLFPWYFLSGILYASSVSGSVINLFAILEYNERYISITLLLLFLSLYISIFPIYYLIKLLYYRNEIEDLLHEVNIMNDENKSEHIFSLIIKMKKTLTRYPLFIFASYLLLILSTIMSLVYRSMLWW